jgi:hypothetical protein
MRTNVLICQIHNVPRRTLRMPHVEQELLTIQEYLSSPPIFRDVRVSLSLVFCLVVCRSLFVLLSFCAWTLHYLSFFDLQHLITSLVSSTFPCLSSLIRILRLSFVFMFILLLICLGLSDTKMCFPSITMYIPGWRYCLRKDNSDVFHCCIIQRKHKKYE